MGDDAPPDPSDGGSPGERDDDAPDAHTGRATIEQNEDTRGRTIEENEGPSVLVVSNLVFVNKVERHWGPLADVAGDLTLVSATEDPGIENIAHRRVPSPGHRLVGIALLFLYALHEGIRGDYDVVASISLVPYGCYALAIGTVLGLPTHLGIIGEDLDRHATAWYGAPVRAAFRRFDAVSVPGTAHARQLVDAAVPPERVSILANAIDAEAYRPAARASEPTYDLLWIGRFNREKNPLLFVRGLRELRDRGVDFDAAMVGKGPLEDAVDRELAAAGLASRVDRPGWVDDPLDYYARSAVFVLTSRRDALPLTLLEAMAVGLASVVPDVGSVTDVAEHGETAYVLEEMTPGTLADALETLLERDGLRRRIGDRAPAVRESYSYDAAREDWREILWTLGCRERAETRDPADPPREP